MKYLEEHVNLFDQHIGGRGKDIKSFLSFLHFNFKSVSVKYLTCSIIY